MQGPLGMISVKYKLNRLKTLGGVAILNNIHFPQPRQQLLANRLAEHDSNAGFPRDDSYKVQTESVQNSRSSSIF